MSKLVFDPLHIDEESLDVDGEGKAALNSATDLVRIWGGGGGWAEGGVGGEKEGAPMFSGGVGRLWLRLIVGTSVEEIGWVDAGMARDLG